MSSTNEGSNVLAEAVADLRLAHRLRCWGNGLTLAAWALLFWANWAVAVALVLLLIGCMVRLRAEGVGS